MDYNPLDDIDPNELKELLRSKNGVIQHRIEAKNGEIADIEGL